MDKLADEFTTVKDKAKWLDELGNVSESITNLLSSDRFRNVYNLYKKRLRTRKYADKLTLEEEAVINFYTRESEKLNKALRGELPLDDFTKSYSELLSRALNKLDNPFNGITYGYYNMPEDYIKARFGRGDYYEPDYFMSSSKSIDEARKVGANANVEITFVDGYSGQMIEDISSLPSELEVLFDKESVFQVLKNDYRDGIYYITLEQM